MPATPVSARDGRSLTCDICDRSFARHEHLQRHSRTHTKEKPYICHCGRSFTRKDLLTRHERLSHKRSKRRPISNSPDNAPAPSQNEPLMLGSLPAPDTQITDPFLPSASLFEGYDDPMLDFTRFMNSTELGVDWDAMLMDSLPQPTPTPNVVPQITPDGSDFSSRVPDDPSGDDDFHELKPLSCPWLLPEPQRLQFQDSLSSFSHVIPYFVLPTRLAIARYMSGYVEGFSNHHPFIHIPTLRILSYRHSPEIILSLMAIGAQYRYETKTALSLYQAARSIILERQRRGDLFQPVIDSVPEVDISCERMNRVRTLLLLASYASWQGQTNMTQESFEYQGLIARSIREVGLLEPSDDENSWTRWVHIETDRRTKFFGWCLLNLHSLAFDTPPLLLSREVNLVLPSSCREWVARNQTEWLEARSHSAMMFKEAHSSHLATGSDHPPVSGVSPMGNYILIHALLQRIYLTQQLSHDAHGQRLSSNDVEELEQALNRWRHTWRTSPESLLDLQNSYASLAFTSTALLGAAHIRLHCNLGPWRDIQSNDPSVIAATLQEAPLPQRGSHLIYALLHSVHALNIPVQLGISYLSRCTSFSWSIHHALCDLECAAFLSKWLRVVAVHTHEPLSALENRVIRWIMRVVREALLSHDETIELGYLIGDSDLVHLQQTTHRLGYAVVKVWAQMFKFCNSPWPVVSLIGQSLDRYAEMINSETPSTV